MCEHRASVNCAEVNHIQITVTTTMATDTTNVKYKCPFCDRTKQTEKRVRQHISSKSDSAHGRHSYDTDRTIEAIHDSIIPDNSSKSVHDEIKTAGERVIEGVDGYPDALDNGGLKKIAEAAGTHHSHVMRVFNDEHIDFSWRGCTPPTVASELSENQMVVLKELNNSPGADYKEITNAIDVDRAQVQTTIEKYSWLLDYDRDGIVDSTFEGTERVENIPDDFNKVEDNDDDYTDDMKNELLNALEDADVEYEVNVSVTEDSWDATKKLLKNDHDDVAEKVNNGEL